MARDRAQEWLLWTIGCILCAHIAGFFGISYFDQVKNWWFVTLAMIPAASMAVQLSNAQRPQPAAIPDQEPTMQFAYPGSIGEEIL
jgi:hypothetical protein